MTISLIFQLSIHNKANGSGSRRNSFLLSKKGFEQRGGRASTTSGLSWQAHTHTNTHHRQQRQHRPRSYFQLDIQQRQQDMYDSEPCGRKIVRPRQRLHQTAEIWKNRRASFISERNEEEVERERDRTNEGS